MSALGLESKRAAMPATRLALGSVSSGGELGGGNAPASAGAAVGASGSNAAVGGRRRR